MRLAALMLVAVIGLAACDRPTSPSAVSTPRSAPPPQTGPPPTPTGSSAVAGIVTERTPLGDRRLSGANVNAWIQTGTFGYSYMWANGPRLSDVEGRYELSNLPEGAELQLQVYKDGYVQQCAAAPIVVGGQMHMDLQLVARANVSASADTVPPSAPGFRLISGVVYELTNDGRRPAPEAPRADQRAPHAHRRGVRSGLIQRHGSNRDRHSSNRAAAALPSVALTSSATYTCLISEGCVSSFLLMGSH